MCAKQLVVAGFLIALLLGGSGVVVADSHHKACPNENPGKGLERSTTASGGTSLTNALYGISQAVDSVECDDSFQKSPLEVRY